MNERNIVVIGASAGGVEALSGLVSHLPAELTAALFIVLHVPRGAPSALPRILSRAGRLPARHARHDERVEAGRLYVAPPDHHLLVHDARVHLSTGPQENGHRPAVDPLFRTAARAYGSRVVGVVLSGVLDDGTAGLAIVKRHGGVAVAQDPEEAHYPGMPVHAATGVAIDHVLPVAEIAALLGRMALEEAPLVDGVHRAVEDDPAEMSPEVGANFPPNGRPSAYACPECNGVLWEVDEGGLARFRCRVGHAWSADSLLFEQAERLEEALWTALRSLEERGALARRLAERAAGSGHTTAQAHFAGQARDCAERAEIIRRTIMAGRPEPAAAEPAGPMVDEPREGAA